MRMVDIQGSSLETHPHMCSSMCDSRALMLTTTPFSRLHCEAHSASCQTTKPQTATFGLEYGHDLQELARATREHCRSAHSKSCVNFTHHTCKTSHTLEDVAQWPQLHCTQSNNSQTCALHVEDTCNGLTHHNLSKAPCAQLTEVGRRFR